MPPKKVESKPTVKSSLNPSDVYRITNTAGIVFVPLKTKTLELIDVCEVDEETARELSENLTCKAMIESGRLGLSKVNTPREETEPTDE